MSDSVASWDDCPVCVTYLAANSSAVVYAAASVGIERKLSTREALALYLKERHAAHA